MNVKSAQAESCSLLVTCAPHAAAPNYGLLKQTTKPGFPE